MTNSVADQINGPTKWKAWWHQTQQQVAQQVDGQVWTKAHQTRHQVDGQVWYLVGRQVLRKT